MSQLEGGFMWYPATQANVDLDRLQPEIENKKKLEQVPHSQHTNLRNPKTDRMV